MNNTPVKPGEVTQGAVAQPGNVIHQMMERMNLIRGFLEKIMKKGVDYGEVPGAGSRFALFKSGAEKLLTAFNLRTNVIAEDLSTPEFVRYRVRVEIISPKGEVLGVGLGECSSREEKYRWREAVCKEEWEETPEERRRIKWKRGQYKTLRTLQVERDPFDTANTVLKMAKKRALVDAVLTVLAVSDIFTQDEDAIEEFVKNGSSAESDLPSPDEPLSSSSAGAEKEKKAGSSEGGGGNGNGSRGPTKAQISYIKNLLREKGLEDRFIESIVEEAKTVEKASKIIDGIKGMSRDEILEKYFGITQSEKAEEIEKEIEEEIF